VFKKIYHFYKYFKELKVVGKNDSKYKNVSKFDIKDADFEELN
tara:strand:- start:196 stop:324 length:129 start_codon:yes stop_codon:yes gene_type:complete